MKDPWLNFQYIIEFSSANGFGKNNSGVCSVLSVQSQAVSHGAASYFVSPVRGDPVKKYVYGGSFTEPINISILLGEGARPWLQWFSEIQSGSNAAARNVTLSLINYGPPPDPESKTDPREGKIWLRWDLINCFPLSWNIGAWNIDDSAQPMKIDMTLQFESMVVTDDGDELHEVIG